MLLIHGPAYLNISPASDCSGSASRSNDCCVTNPVNRQLTWTSGPHEVFVSDTALDW